MIAVAISSTALAPDEAGETVQQRKHDGVAKTRGKTTCGSDLFPARSASICSYLLVPKLGPHRRRRASRPSRHQTGASSRTSESRDHLP